MKQVNSGPQRRLLSLLDDWGWLLLLAASPFLLFPSPARSPALLVLPGLFILAWLAGREPVPRTPLNGALLLLCLMVLVSLYATFDIAFSLPKVAGVLLGVAAYHALLRRLDTRRKLWLAVQAFVLAGAGLAVVGLLGTDWLGKVPALGRIVGRLPAVIRGLSGAEGGFQPNAVGGALLFFIPLQLTLLAATFRRDSSDKTGDLPPRSLGTLRFLMLSRLKTFALSAFSAVSWSPRIQLALLALTGGVLLLTQSRGAWLGFTLAMAALFAWHSPRSRKLLALALVGVGVALLIMGPQDFLALASHQVGSGLASDAAGRQELWSRAIYGVQDFPFTGMGMNAFRRVMPVLYPAFLISPDVDVAHAHNHLLQVALDLGLPGLIAYLALWLGAAHMLISAYRLACDRWLRAVAAGLGAGLIAHFVFGMGDAIALGAKVGIVFWIVLALVVGVYQVALEQHD